MFEFIKKILFHLPFSDKVNLNFTYIIFSAVIILLCFLSQIIFQKVIAPILHKAISHFKHPLIKFMKQRNFLNKVAYLLVPLIISFFSPQYKDVYSLLQQILLIYTMVVLMIILSSVLSILDDFYKTLEVSKKRPITAFLQIVKVVLGLIFITIVIATWIGQSPIVLLSGIGAFTAIITLVFRDTILGFVAGIQLTNNDLIRIGDWIELENSTVSGIVQEISLVSVKVENFDNTISNVPAYNLMSGVFKNWRNMQQSGNRRMIRSIQIDILSIQALHENSITHLQSQPQLKQFWSQHFAQLPVSKSNPKEKLTNLDFLQRYLSNFLENHPRVNRELTCNVRILPTQSNGISLEILCFIMEISFVPFEQVQSEIFHHLFLIAPFLDIRFFQYPSGYSHPGKEIVKEFLVDNL